MPSIPFIDDDIDCFFQENELAIKAIFETKEILVIYREGYLNVGDGIVGIDNSEPYMLVKESDVTDIKRGDPLEIQGEFYLVSAVRPADSELYKRVFLEVV